MQLLIEVNDVVFLQMQEVVIDLIVVKFEFSRSTGRSELKLGFRGERDVNGQGFIMVKESLFQLVN